jgi:hypothetical protein
MKVETLDAETRRRLLWLYKRKDTLRPMAAGGFCRGLGLRESL